MVVSGSPYLGGIIGREALTKNTQKETEEGKKKVAEKECFVIMPISDPEHDDYVSGHFSRVYNDLIVPACKLSGYKAVRADEVSSANLIHLDILDKIVSAPLAICDLSGQNPNVMFELGMRQAFDKPVVLIKDELTKSVFDINGIRYHPYPSSLRYDEVLKFQTKLSEAIDSTMQDCAERNGANSIVKLLEINKATLSAGVDATEADKFLLLQSQLKHLEAMVRDISRSSSPDAGTLIFQYKRLLQDAVETVERSGFSIGARVRRLRDIAEKMKRLPVVDKETSIMQDRYLQDISELIERIESGDAEKGA